MVIAVGILFVDATEFEIHVGGNLTPPLDIRSVKKILDTGGLRTHCGRYFEPFSSHKCIMQRLTLDWHSGV